MTTWEILGLSSVVVGQVAIEIGKRTKARQRRRVTIVSVVYVVALLGAATAAVGDCCS